MGMGGSSLHRVHGHVRQLFTRHGVLAGLLLWETAAQADDVLGPLGQWLCKGDGSRWLSRATFENRTGGLTIWDELQYLATLDNAVLDWWRGGKHPASVWDSLKREDISLDPSAYDSGPDSIAALIAEVRSVEHLLVERVNIRASADPVSRVNTDLQLRGFAEVTCGEPGKTQLSYGESTPWAAGKVRVTVADADAHDPFLGLWGAISSAFRCVHAITGSWPVLMLACCAAQAEAAAAGASSCHAASSRRELRRW